MVHMRVRLGLAAKLLRVAEDDRRRGLAVVRPFKVAAGPDGPRRRGAAEAWGLNAAAGVAVERLVEVVCHSDGWGAWGLGKAAVDARNGEKVC